MAQSGARSLGDRTSGTGHDHDHDKGRGGNLVDAKDDGRHKGMTPAQWYCLLAGLALLLAGIFGFLADASFDTGGSADGEANGNADGQLQGDGFLGFEVNGWHNIVHLLSGLLLLSAFRKRTAAKTVALAFGIVYGLVALIGLIDGSDVLGIIPVNPADNILHIALSLAGIIAALVSPREEKHRTSTAPATPVATGTTTGRTVATPESGRDTRFDRQLDPRDQNPGDRGEQNINR
jgi:hypothetical protein